MEAADVQAAPAAGRKSPRLPAMARLLLQGDVGQSSSSCCGFESSRDEQSGSTTRNNPSMSSSTARQLQQQRAGDAGRLSLTRFEQHAEQLLQQEQGLQVDQILDLLGLLLKRQHPEADREASLPHQQQGSTSLSTVGATDVKRQAQNNAASPSDTALGVAAASTTRQWTNTDELARHGENGFSGSNEFAADGAAAAREFLRRRRDSDSSVLRRSQPRQQEQPQQRVPNSAAAGGGTTTDECLGSNSHFTMVGSNSGSPAFVEERHQQDTLPLISAGPAEWTGNSPQQQSRRMVATAAAAVGTAAFKGAGADSMGRSNGSGSAACSVVQQPKNGPPSPSRLPLRLGPFPADPLGTTMTGTRMRDARQPPRQQVQHLLLQQQQLQHQVRQQQLQLPHTRAQQYATEQHYVPHPQHAQHVQQQAFGQRQLQELQQQQQADKQLQRGEIDENLLNDETRQLLSRSLDVLMGDVNIQTLKDLLLRKVPAAGSGSRTNSGCNAETSYSAPTHVTAGDAVSFDAAVLSLLQQQPHQQRQQQQHQQRNQQQPEADGDVLRRNCTPESKREVQPFQEKKQHPVGENQEERTFPGSPVFPPSPTNMARDLGRSPGGMDEAIYATAAGQRQQSHMRKAQHRQVSQEQPCVQQREKRTGSKTSTASASSHFEGPPPYYSIGSPTKMVKDESVNTKKKAAAEAVVTAGAAGNKRTGAAQRQQLQQAERKRGRHTRPSSPEDNTGRGRQSHAKLGESASCGGAGCGASSISPAAEPEEQESCRAVRKARLCAVAARGGSFVESSPSDESPPPAHWDRASLLKSSASTAVEGAAAAAAAGVGSLGYAASGGNSCGNQQQAAAVLPQSQQQLAAASLSCRLQKQRNGEILGFLDSPVADDESAEDAVNAAAKKRLTPGDPGDTEERVATRKGQAFEPPAAAAAEAAEAVRRGCSPLPPYRNGRRRVQEPCELALAAARLEQQGHTFTPPFYLHATTSNSNGGSRCSAVRENCKRSDAAAGGGDEKKEKDSECINEEEARGPPLDQQQCKKGAAQEGEEEHIHDNMEEEDEEMEGEHLTQQQLTLLKHIYSVLSQAEEYFSFKSALYQLHIKRHLKKCVSSLAAAAAANSASSDKDASPHTTAGGNKHHRSPVHAGSTQSKAIRLFTSMPPIPINAVEQRALLSVRKHLQAGGGGALLCQGDGVAQLLMEELDELLTSLVNKLLLIIVVKFQTCFIHAPARAQLREFLVSFVFPGDMATQLLFRDHVQAVVHARIRHFRDSVGRTLRHQPPPSPPLAAASVTRSGTKRSTRIAAASASSPTSRPTEEEGDEEEDRQKKQKLYEVLVDMEERENRRRAAAASPAGRLHYCSDRRKTSSAPLAPDAAAHPSANLSHSAARVAIQHDGGQSRQNSSSNERKASPASRSPRNKEPYRGRSLSSSDAKETTRGVGAFAGINNKAAAPGREGGRLSRAGEHGSAAAATKTAAAGVLTPAQRKGTNAGTGGPATAGGCGSGTNVRTRGGVYNRRKRGQAAASESAEARCPSASSSRYGPSAATRRGGSCPSTDTSSSGSVRSSEGATNQSQQQSGRETTSSARRGVATTATGVRIEPKPTSGSATPAGRNLQYAGGGATEDLPQAYSGSNLQKPEGGRRGERTTRGGPPAEVTSGRTSPNPAQPRSPSPVPRSPQENSVQQQLLQQQQLPQPHCSSGARGEVAGRWATTAVLSDEATEESYYERGRRSFAIGAEGGRGRSGSRISILSRGSTRESACDPLSWEQADGPRPKGCLPKVPVQEAQQCALPTLGHMTTKQVVSNRGSVDSGGELASAANAASEAAGVGDDLPWTALGKGEEDEATQALAAALGVALDPNNGDSAGGAAGEVWDWLAVAGGSKDEQQEKLRQTLETLLNAWTTSGTNEGRNVRGIQGSEAPGSNSRSALGATNGSNSSADGWLNLAMAEFSCAREKKGRPTQPEEMNINHFDTTGNAVHFSSAGMSGKDASLPSPSSVKNPPSEASTSFPPHEERTPPAERSAAESADADATRSPEDRENSAASRRGSVVCLPDGSLHTGRAAAAAERIATAASGTATIMEGRGGGGAGPVRPLRIPLPKEVNSAHGTAYESEAAALEGLTHNTIADFLLTYCKEDASGYEIAGQLKHCDTTVSTAAIDATTTVASTSHGGVQAEAYVDPRLRDDHLLSTLSHTSADKLTMKGTAGNDELPALRAETVATSRGGANTLAYSLSSLFAGSIPLPS